MASLLLACSAPPAKRIDVVTQQQGSPSPPPDAAATTASPPPSRTWPALVAGYPDLPRTVEGLLVKTTIGGAELIDDTRSRLNVSDGRYVFLVPGQRGRIVYTDAAKLGITADAAIVEIERDTATGPCTPALAPTNPHYICVKKLRRLDAGATYKLDAGGALATLLAEYAPAAEHGQELLARSAHALDAISDPPGSRHVAVPSYPPLHPIGFAVAWSREGLDVLVAARSERAYSLHERSTDPHAGTIGCEAPPGADCAPRCRPPGWTLTRVSRGEAGVRVTFDTTGRETRRSDAGEGQHGAREVGRVDDPCR